MAKQYYQGETFRDPDPALLQEAEFNDCTFTDCRWEDVRVRNCTFLSCTFQHCSWSGVVFSFCQMRDAWFSGGAFRSIA